MQDAIAVEYTEVEVRRCKVRLQRAGRGEPLLFLHGAQGLNGWEPGLEALSKSFDVIAPDHPGFGQSDNSELIDDASDLAFFYFDLLDTLELDSVHVVGQCIGGWVALEMAIRTTGRLKSLVLVSSAGIRVKGVPRADMFVCSQDELLKLLFAGNGAAEWLQSWRATPDLEDIYDRNRAAAAKFSWSPRLFNPKLERWLHRIDIPTHIVWGHDDRLIPPAYAAVLTELIAGATVNHAAELRASAAHRAAAGLRQRGLAIHPEGGAMKVFCFHLMPYAYLDMSYTEKYRAAWVVLPNTYFDPKKGHELYNRYLDELELVAELGYDGISVNEHHQNAYGLMPSPVVMAAALARRTKNAKIAILGSAFCLREHPLTLAEEHAMIDCITGGRLISGMVRGIGAEYYSMGVNPTISHARFQEAHDLVVQAWTRPGPFAFEGKHYHFEYVNLWPRPYQQPHPPIWAPSTGSTETIEWAAHPSRKYVYLQAYSPIQSVARYLNYYRECAQKMYGYTAQLRPDRLVDAGVRLRHRPEGARRGQAPHRGTCSTGCCGCRSR